NPAAFNNVFGFRTSFGRIPSDSADAFVPSLGVAGPMARTIPDLAMMLATQAGYDARAPLSNPQDPGAFRASLERDFNGVRIAWPGDFGGYLPFEPAVLELCIDSLKTFEQMGCVVEETRPEFPIDQVWRDWLKLRAWQVGSRLKELYIDPGKRAYLKPEAQWEIESGFKLTAYDLSDACAGRTEWYHAVRRLFGKYDYFVLPSAQVFPFDASVHWPREIAGRAMDTYHRWMEVTIPVTMAGCPALNVPAGFNRAGLPIGMQIVGPNHGELACLQLAYAYDQATGWIGRRPPSLLNAVR
ncbi:MAG TPA: amidase family protein, partial [Candidatus Binataceae bacterium]|nr:amidase family protein [Candidatus Binataceae bacterium]